MTIRTDFFNLVCGGKGERVPNRRVGSRKKKVKVKVVKKKKSSRNKWLPPGRILQNGLNWGNIA